MGLGDLFKDSQYKEEIEKLKKANAILATESNKKLSVKQLSDVELDKEIES